jgi:amino acid transporter
MFGYLGGMTLSMPRMLYAFARDGFVPQVLGAVHSRYHSPHVAVVTQSLVALALAISGTFERLAILANVSALALYLGCALAARQLRTSDASAAGTGVRLGSVVPWLACAVIVWLLTGLTRSEWLAFGACLAGGTLVYLVTRGHRAATRAVSA